MSEFNDDEISEDPNPFSNVPPPPGPLGPYPFITVPTPSGPSGPSGPQTSIYADFTQTPDSAQGQRPKRGPLKRKRASGQRRRRATVTEETEPLEDTPSVKRVQADHDSLPTPAETPSTVNASHPDAPSLQRSSSPLSPPSWLEDMQQPPTPERQPSTPPRYTTPPSFSTPSLQRSPQRDRPEHENDTPGPSQEPAVAPPAIITLREIGTALMNRLERTHERDRKKLIQLVIASSQGERSCSAYSLCLYRRNLVVAMNEPYWIKVNWPQIATGEGAGRPAELYHVICWESMIYTDTLLQKKLFPKMVETERGDSRKVGLMARQWLECSGHVFPDKMMAMLDEVKINLKPGEDIAKVWRLKCEREVLHLADRTFALSAIIMLGDTYV
ncbi:hypothetical protein FGADI_9526 [Fusarium gaditjirri]|uniref:Uncharacterized protein n=1 Tax=Fusarium gaditjirri TaxID=282569 RepID=A0A8H4SZG1_9HYPO|nr:hypothetical protein FGADI_9526 [Fusarium gaditjirri]